MPLCSVLAIVVTEIISVSCIGFLLSMNFCNSERTLHSHLMLVAILMEYMSANKQNKMYIPGCEWIPVLVMSGRRIITLVLISDNNNKGHNNKPNLAADLRISSQSASALPHLTSSPQKSMATTTMMTMTTTMTMMTTTN
jgi:hypothetical protein